MVFQVKVIFYIIGIIKTVLRKCDYCQIFFSVTDVLVNMSKYRLYSLIFISESRLKCFSFFPVPPNETFSIGFFFKLRPYFLRAVLDYSKNEGKVPIHTHSLSHDQYPLPEQNTVKMDEPAVTYYNYPWFIVYFMATLHIVHSMGLHKGRIHVSSIMVHRVFSRP